MAKVRSFVVHDTRGVPDSAIAAFITECEAEHYVSVTTLFIPVPSPRVTVIVTKLDEKELGERQTATNRPRPYKFGDPIPRCTNDVP